MAAEEPGAPQLSASEQLRVEQERRRNRTSQRAGMPANTRGMRPQPVTLNVEIIVDENDLDEDLFKFPIEVATTWPLLTVVQQIENKFNEILEFHQIPKQLALYCLLKPEAPARALNYKLPVITYFEPNSRIMAQGELDSVDPPLTESDKLPVTIITGFLGAGKTTLMNYILHEQSDHKFFIIQNEFGDVSIDDELVENEMKSSSTENIVSLDNGCLCCTVRGDLEQTFQSMMEMDLDVEGVLVETTGMANPKPIIATFLQTPNIGSKMRLDCIVTVVAANHIEMQLERDSGDGENEAISQVICANRIILNKIDLIEPVNVRHVKNIIRSLNPLAKIIPAQNASISIPKILNVQAFNLQAILDDEENFFGGHHGDENEEHDHSHHHHSHDHNEEETHEEENHSHDHGHDHHDHEEENHSHDHGHDHHDHEEENHSHDHGHDHHDHEEENHSHDHGHDDHHDHGHDHHDHGHDDHHDHGHDHHGHSHDHHGCTDPSHNHGVPEIQHSSGVNSVGIREVGEVDMRSFQQFLGSLETDDLYRTKGILRIAGNDKKFVFHGIHDVFDFDFIDQEWENDEEPNKLVFIGKNMDKEDLTEGFKSCLV